MGNKRQMLRLQYLDTALGRPDFQAWLALWADSCRYRSQLPFCVHIEILFSLSKMWSVGVTWHFQV